MPSLIERPKLTLTRNQRTILSILIREVEEAHFRTDEDTGANLNALFIWNLVRAKAELPPLAPQDLPSYCTTCDRYHVNPHTRPAPK